MERSSSICQVFGIIGARCVWICGRKFRCLVPRSRPGLLGQKWGWEKCLAWLVNHVWSRAGTTNMRHENLPLFKLQASTRTPSCTYIAFCYQHCVPPSCSRYGTATKHVQLLPNPLKQASTHQLWIKPSPPRSWVSQMCRRIPAKP